MANLKDKEDFDKYQLLYRKLIKEKIDKLEMEKMIRLRESLKDKIGEEILDNTGKPIYQYINRDGISEKLALPQTLGHQIHHLIPWSLRNNPIWSALGMTINENINLMNLPTKAAAFLLENKKVSVHEGKHPGQVKGGIARSIGVI